MQSAEKPQEHDVLYNHILSMANDVDIWETQNREIKHSIDTITGEINSPQIHNLQMLLMKKGHFQELISLAIPRMDPSLQYVKTIIHQLNQHLDKCNSLINEIIAAVLIPGTKLLAEKKFLTATDYSIKIMLALYNQILLLDDQKTSLNSELKSIKRNQAQGLAKRIRKTINAIAHEKPGLKNILFFYGTIIDQASNLIHIISIKYSLQSLSTELKELDLEVEQKITSNRDDDSACLYKVICLSNKINTLKSKHQNHISRMELYRNSDEYKLLIELDNQQLECNTLIDALTIEILQPLLTLIENEEYEQAITECAILTDDINDQITTLEIFPEAQDVLTNFLAGIIEIVDNLQTGITLKQADMASDYFNKGIGHLLNQQLPIEEQELKLEEMKVLAEEHAENTNLSHHLHMFFREQVDMCNDQLVILKRLKSQLTSENERLGEAFQEIAFSSYTDEKCSIKETKVKFGLDQIRYFFRNEEIKYSTPSISPICTDSAEDAIDLEISKINIINNGANFTNDESPTTVTGTTSPPSNLGKTQIGFIKPILKKPEQEQAKIEHIFTAGQQP